MKIELTKNSNGKVVGWKITAETTEERLTLGTIRNMEFFGVGDNHVVYDGMESLPEDENYVNAVKYCTRGHSNQVKAEQQKAMEEWFGKDKLFDVCYNGKTTEVTAKTKYEAIRLAADEFGTDKLSEIKAVLKNGRAIDGTERPR